VIFTEWTGVPSSSHVKLASIATGQVRDLLAGAFARYTGDGHLVFIGPGQSLERVAFDLSSGRIRGEPVVVNDSVYVPGDGSAQFAISQTGTLAYLPSLGRRVPVIVDWDGVATPVRAVNPDLYMSPRYAPHDGRFAMEVAQGSADIWLYDPDGETFSKISDGGGYYSVWTPDGSRILYSRDEQAEVNVYSVPVNRSEGRRTVLAHHGQERTQDLSHDGKHLLLRQSTGPGQYDLFVMAPDSGAAPTPWLVTPFLERAPAFSPNDRWVAYSSNESGKDEVYVRPFAGPGGRIPVSSGGGIEPAWSRDGSELFYRASDGSLVMVKVEAGATFRVVSRPTTLFQNHYYAYAWARQYDVAADGRHFLFLRNEAAEINLNVVVNWIAADQGGPPR
jgi:Tol biopolymer transport system component